jgi:hypothetical protein
MWPLLLAGRRRTVLAVLRGGWHALCRDHRMTAETVQAVALGLLLILVAGWALARPLGRLLARGRQELRSDKERAAPDGDAACA